MDPCNVCGGTDVTLVDGYYYCVECGTQDVNVQETVVEQTVMADGTFAHATVRKFTTVLKDGVEMSSEWHKWHIFNFILAGLTDELISLGAKPSVKMKVLWVWTRYVKEFQIKDDAQSKSKLDIYDDDLIKHKGDDDKEDSGNDDSDEKSTGKKKSNSNQFSRDIKVVTKGTLLAILYVALNLDRSDIQLSHLLRFIREGRLSLYKCMKFVPKELNIKAIVYWKSFVLVDKEYSPISIRALAMTCFKRLKLGVPLVPDLRKIIKNYIQELCLPDDVRELVFALMHYVPIDFLDIDLISQRSLVRIPDYEGICMTYVIVALKMCFGLDGEYEVRISREIDKINDEESYLKSYKLGLLSEPSDRLFSFTEWCQHLQFRKSILCKHYLPISRQFNCIANDYMFMEHLEARRKTRDTKLSDDVTMDILNKINTDEKSQIISKDDFPATLTPMSTYINIIAQQTKEPDLRLLLSEDFTQYSLKYAIKNLKLHNYKNDTENIIVGVSELGKNFNSHVTGTLNVKEGDTTLVFVRNCQNKNWLKTQPPTADHVINHDQNENSSDKESDHGYDSNVESSILESEATHITVNDESVYTKDKKLEVIEELDDEKSIFDDNFIDVPLSTFNEIKEEIHENDFEVGTDSNGLIDSKIGILDNTENHSDTEMSIIRFNPNLFDREKMIAKLIELARKKYKIPAPKDSSTREPRKRRINIINDEASSSEPKRKRTENRAKPGEIKEEVNKLLSAYYGSLQRDALHQVSQQVKSFLDNVDTIENTNIVDHNDLNETNDINNESELNSLSNLNIEETQADINMNAGDDAAGSSQKASQDEQIPEQETLNESEQNESVEELFTKSDPNFDEKEHDIKQLYVKLGDTNANDITLTDIEDDIEIDKIIQRKIEEFSSLDTCTLNESNVNKTEVIDNIEEASDSEDDIPLNTLKETICNQKEKEERRKDELEPLIHDSTSVEKFNYWVRHYKARSVERSTDMAKKFDLELKENLPISFVLVIRECASILGCSMFSLYRNMQNIEEILISY